FYGRCIKRLDGKDEEGAIEMKITPDFPILSKIHVSDVVLYLGAHGWRSNRDFPNDLLLVFEKKLQGNSELFLTLPRNEALADYQMRLADLVNQLSIIEKRPQDQIIADLLRPSVDVLQMRDYSN